MDKKYLSLLLSSFLLFGSFFAISSVHAEEFKIAIMDVQEILRTAPQVNSIKEKLKAEFAPRQNQLITAQRTLQTDIEKLQTDHAKMDKKTLDNLQKQIQSEERDIQSKQASLQKDVFAAQDKALQGLLAQIRSKGKEVAEQKQFSLVLAKDTVIYAKGQADITADVRDRMK